MFTKILIANRGEIAVRIAKTARMIGVQTVAIYSDADADALHVAIADEAVHIGPAPVAQSYLQAQRIIDAALQTGAQAIHPGYGFLSENPDFADMVEAAGLVFIGPPATAIRAMGLKDAAKRAMEEAGVPVVPGFHGENASDQELLTKAREIGFPVLIKARAGGGGKGMRRVEHEAAFLSELAAAQSEGLASFGDPACLVEKYVATPRHIEIQIFGDHHGNAVHLHERDCSLQRRHQKVIEEAPAPDMPAQMRAQMGEAAVRAAKAIGYAGAGTVEFIVDASDGLRADRFYFMEMNTRLQVEHPVTEAITGVDLVEWQLRIAAGEALPMAQADIPLQGWAFEARLYAEDAAKGFLPAIGTLTHLHLPDDLARIDTGVRENDSVTPFYDPMIAKIVTHGATRNEALQKLANALAAARIAGCVTNLDFLSRLCTNESFAHGDVDTGLIERDFDTLTTPLPQPQIMRGLAAVAACGLLQSGGKNSFRLWGSETRSVALVSEELEHVELAINGGGSFTADGLSFGIVPHQDGYRIKIDNQPLQTAHVAISGQQISVFINGRSASWQIPDPLAVGADDMVNSDAIIAPMPGLLKTVFVKAGDRVQEGDALLIMEAMKMEHRLSAPRDGIVAELLHDAGAQLEEGTLLLALEEQSDG